MIKKCDKKNTSEEVKELVIARLRAFSGDKKISIGSKGKFSIDELINRVEKDDEIGKKIVEIQLQYLRSLKEGIFLPQ